MGTLSDPAENVDRYYEWVVPESEGAQYVPDAAAVDRIVGSLEETGWIRGGPRPRYDPDGPFYFSIFPGAADGDEVRPGDPLFDLSAALEPVIRRTHSDFAVIVELWYPPRPRTVLSVDPHLLGLLREHTGYSFRTDAQ